MAISTLNGDHNQPGVGHLLRTIGQPSEIGSLRPRFAKEDAATLSISSLGAEAGFLETQLGEIGDRDAQRRARGGLRSIVGEVGGSPGALLDVTVALRRRHQADPASVTRVLGAADQAAAADLTVAQFARTFERLERSGLVGEFADSLADQVQQIATLDGTHELRQQTLDDLLEQVDGALGATGSVSAGLETMFDKLESQDTLQDKADLLMASA